MISNSTSSKAIRRALALTLFAGFTAVPLLGMARTTSAVVGHTDPGAASSCFVQATGALVNVCSTTQRVFFPLQVDISGTKSVSVVARSSVASNNVCCRAVGTDSGAQGAWGSNSMCLPNFGTPQTLSLNGGYVPSAGTMYVYCDVGAGALVASVNVTNP